MQCLIRIIMRQDKILTCLSIVSGIDYINRDNFLTELDNGVVLCHLAQLICNQAKDTIKSGLAKGVRIKK